MSPKTKVTHEQILDTAFEIAEAEGLKTGFGTKSSRRLRLFGRPHLCQL